MLDQVNAVFDIVPEYDLDILSQGQTLYGITTKSLIGLESVINEVRPAALLVQGDTTTAFAGALAAFYRQVAVVHLEAGLRTSNRFNPYPEEMNRRLTSQIADVHLAPTNIARDNLLREGIPRDRVIVTGNTVIDALFEVTSVTRPLREPRLDSLLRQQGDRPLLLVTTHRRESWGDPLRRTAAAVAELSRKFPELLVVLPAHRNPVVREAILPPLTGLGNVLVTEPLDYPDFCQTVGRSTVVLTDSGGVQEEAPSLGKPVLVLRDTTERPEAVLAGGARLVGTDQQRIVDEVSRLLTDPTAHAAMARARNPYGDGLAARRSVEAIAAFLGVGEPPKEFSVGSADLGEAETEPGSRDPGIHVALHA
jgi:UDP-N-acetylglucosamine 2-epimerase (non-hydrolysing)